MNEELIKALRPVKRRIRRNRFLRGLAWGLAAGTAAALALRVTALFVPAEDRWLRAVLPAAGFALLFAAVNALRPAGNRTAAEAADACGLQERTVTALEQAESRTEICALQREDAYRALKGLDVRRIRPGSVRKPLLAALACGVLTLALLAVPNPRDREADARRALRGTLKEGMEQITRAAEEDAGRLSPEKQSELRRLTEDLKRDLQGSRDETDALVALDRAEQRLEQMQNRTAGDAAAAAGTAGSESAAGEGAWDGEAADGTGTAADGKTAQASAGQTGKRTGQLSTQKALTALKTAVNPAAAQKGTQAAASGQQGESGQGEGLNGQGIPAAGGRNGRQAANGAGEGSTNLEAGAGGQRQNGTVRGNRDPKYKEAEYETIYDPERTETAVRDEMTNQNRTGNGESQQAETGPGRGSLGGSVPWDEVFREYEETETRSAEHENLTEKERQWVAEYYSLLTEQKE